MIGGTALAANNPLGIPGAVLQPDGTYLIGEYNGLPDDAPQYLKDMIKDYKPDPKYMPRCVPMKPKYAVEVTNPEALKNNKIPNGKKKI